MIPIETGFSCPEVRASLVQAVSARERTVLLFVFFLIATAIILAKFLVDILYGIIDPRVQVDK